MLCRYKQAFQQPGAPTAAINYYRALIDCATWWVTDSLHLPFYCLSAEHDLCNTFYRIGHLESTVSESSSACCRYNNPAFRKASKALAEGKLRMPVLMLYADSDTALGTQLVKVSKDQLCRHHYEICSSKPSQKDHASSCSVLYCLV